MPQALLTTSAAVIALLAAVPARAGPQTNAPPSSETDQATPVPAQASPTMPEEDMPAMPDGMADDGAGMAMAMEIVVTATRTRGRFATPTSGAVLSGDALERDVRATLGDTLAHLPGISSNAFGPNASRPVLRGFQGERTRLLIGGISSLDVSNTSPDHAVAINPLVADRIEVVRGPEALRYASGAIGGVVNTVGARLADHLPANGLSVKAEGGYASAADEFTLGATGDVTVADGAVLHLDGHYLSASDQGIGGYVLAPSVRAQALASPDAGVRALAGLRGVLPNTSAQTWEIAGGAARIFSGGYAAFSASYFDSYYGLPTRFSLDPATPVPNTSIDLGQTRLDGVVQFDLGGPVLESVRARLGWADYRHLEIDTDAGVVTSTFLNRGVEGRLEAVFARQGKWDGSLGFQAYNRAFRVDAAAPLLPPTETRQLAVFSKQKLRLGAVTAEAGLRYERTDISAQGDPRLGSPADRLAFDAFSAAASIGWRVAPTTNLGLTAQYSERAPVVEELYTQGTDPGTQGVLLGNPLLTKERSWGFEALARHFGAHYSIELSAFYTRFPSYIYAGETGAVVGGLPVFQFFQNRAAYYGFEAQAKVDVARVGAWKFGTDLLIDGTWADLLGTGPAPRIPPLRMLGGIDAKTGWIEGRAEAEWVTRQDRVTAFETPTASFILVNLSAKLKPWGAGSPMSLLVAGNNLLNAEARRAGSFLKDYAPIAGREVRLTLRAAF